MLSVRTVVWGILLTVFFISTAFALRLPGHHVFVSPDENAAFTFSQLLSHQGVLSYPEALNNELGGVLHPRSTVPFGASILPGSFLGLIVLTGLVGAVFGASGSLLVTPFFAVLSVLAWRKIVATLFKNELLADLAGFFFLIHPAFWYYSGRVMMHNVVFVAFVIFAGWFMVTLPLKKYREVNYFLAGASVGVALLIRLSEVSWIVGGFLMLFVLYRRVIGWRAMLATVLGLALMLAVQFGLNASVYGAPFSNGYTTTYEYDQVVEVVATPVSATAPLKNSHPVLNLILPFGFHERVILQNIWGYGFWLYPALSGLAAIGMLLVVFKQDEQKKTWRMFLLGTLVLAVWLGLVYGSWKIADNPDPFAVTLGNSHVRYWLPLFVLASLFCARTIWQLLGRTPLIIKAGDVEGLLRHGAAAGAAILTIVLSAQLVYGSEDGFLHSRAALKTFVEKEEKILALTELESVIIVDRADKYLFPERRVITPLRSERTYAAMPQVVEEVPLYYFGITFPEADLTYLNTEKLAVSDLQITLVATMNEESLYIITKR